MSAWVTLRNGKVLQYNSVDNYSYNATGSAINLTKNGDVHTTILMEQIERIDWVRPCRIYREQRKDKLPILKGGE